MINNLISAAVLMAAVLFAPAAALALPKPARVGEWMIQACGNKVPIRVFVPAADAPGGSRRGRPAIIYLQNLPTPRIGQEPDEKIIADFLADGYVVLTVDLQKSAKAAAPTINGDLWLMRRHMDSLFSAERVDQDHVYILPEGYRLARDVTYYGEGRWAFRMDIRYPARPKRPVPLLMQISIDNPSRMSNKYSHWLYNEMIAEGALTRGYAAAQVDNPVKHYKGVDPVPEIAYTLKAAVRTVRAKAEEFGYDGDHVAVMGFSRSSGQAGILAMSGGIEKLEGDGPHKEFSSRVQCALLHGGRMDHEALLASGEKLGQLYLGRWGDPKKNKEKWDAHSAVKYVTPDDPPTFLCVGGSDSYRTEQIRLMAEALKKVKVEHRHVVVPEMGHQVVSDSKVLGEIYEFFDRHLKPPATTKPSRRGAKGK